ncbi:MAG: TrkA family potassium uptake protein [Methanoregulaceae archaeon]|jgi:trk system potassium uptake protein TrkA|nr:TrkA family potassium uptake protein [Methanoregulaceae archaeon]
MYMILIGGGNVGLYLAKRLLSGGHEVLLLERDPRHAQRLASIIGSENVMVGDGCEMLTQKDAGFGRADVVVAVTGEDEDNLVVCQMAKVVWHCDRVLARVNDPSHETVFEQIGIDDTVSATGIIHALLEQQIRPDVMLPVGALAKGNLEVVEVVLGPRSPVLHKRVRDLVLPPHTNIVYILRGEQGLLVHGDTELEIDDMLVALVSRDHALELRALLEP